MLNTASEPFTLRSVMERALDKHRFKTAVVSHDDELSYDDLDRRANALANGFADLGIARNDRVALFMANSAALVVARIAIIKAGATFVPVNPAASVGEFEYVIEDATPDAVVVDDERVETVAESDGDEYVAVVAGEEPVRERLATDAIEFDAIVDKYDDSRPPAVDSEPTDLAGHHFTGGTTGRPKGVLFTQENRTANLYAHIMEFGIGEEDVILLTTPLAHAARLFLKSGLLVGATIHVEERFDAGAWLDAVEHRDVTLTFMVPTMIYRVLDHPDLDATDTGSLREVVYGAAPISVDRLREALDAFGPVFTQLYGQTEVPNLVTTLDKHDHEVGLRSGHENVLRSVGKPCTMADVKIVDVETGEPVERGEEGEIVATAAYTMKEYHDRPDATAETMVDGWVHTGDVGRIDEDGYLHVLDRLGNVIISGGMNVYSVEVEDALASHSAVADCCVVGVPDPDWGEAVVAAAVTNEDVDPEALREHAGERLADYKKPKRIEIVEELPRTPYGKVDKNEVEERLS